VRLLIAIVAVVAVTACSDSNTSPKPPTNPSFDTLTTGSISSAGGTITVNKSGDPLNGLTLNVPSGAYDNTMDVTIGSTSNQNLPTANGIVPISPLVHVVTSTGGYAHGAIEFKIPVTVPANTFPVAVMYDSSTGALEPMTTIAYDGTSVTAITGHLSQPTIASPSAARIGGSSRVMASVMASSASPDSLLVTFGVYAIPVSVLNQDWDTGFHPGTNDWEMRAFATEADSSSVVLGVGATELWYFNSQASSTPLNKRFAAVHNAPLSDTIGYHWVSQIDGQVSNQVNSYLSSAYNRLTNSAVDADSLQFDQIRASFAIPTLNGGRSLPVFVDLQSAGINTYYYLIAYKATGNQIYVADPVSPGDQNRFLQLTSTGMTPYVNPSYRNGVSFSKPLGTQLGLAIPLPVLAASYPQAVAGTAGASLFPASGLYSWNGQLYDTLYVVDSLRFWAQCAGCQYGFASTLSPAPSAKVATSFQIYTMSNGLVTDSIGSLSSNGLLITATNPVPGTQKVIGLPLTSATSASEESSGSRRWLDWHQVTIANLKGTVTLPADSVNVGETDTLKVTFVPNLLPSNVAYQWTFGDSTPTVTVQNSASVPHTYAKGGRFTTSVKVIDNRNNQVIARVDTALKSNNVELWRMQSFTWLYTTVNGVVSDTAKPALAFDIPAGVVPTFLALNGPPFPGGDYPEAGFGFAPTPDSAQQWPQVVPQPLAISAPYGVFTGPTSYSNTGTTTSGTITGQAMGGSGGNTGGFIVDLVKKGSVLSGYIKHQASGEIAGVPTTIVVVDTLVAVRVP
jgi:hypothetical protein